MPRRAEAPVVARRSSQARGGGPLESLLRVEVAAVAGAVVGVVLVSVAGAVDPIVCVLSVGALAALAAYTAGDPSPKATLIPRLLLAGAYVAAGVRHPTTLGVIVAIFGASLGVLACAASRSSARSDPWQASRGGPS